MILTKEQKHEFEAAVKPLIKWINDKCDPHTKVIVEPTCAEVVSGEQVFNTTEFVND